MPDRLISGTTRSFAIEGIGEWDLMVPDSVYPPREDTFLLGRAISKLKIRGGKAVEIGCGSGAISLVLASLGWEVKAFDINPIAVLSSRVNIEKHGFSDKVTISEGAIGEGLEIPEDADLVVWNLPYLERIDNEGKANLEEMALSDIDNGGWGRELLECLTKEFDGNSSNPLVMLLMRTDPPSNSCASDWKTIGWSGRSVDFQRMGDEKIEVFAFWRPGSGTKPVMLQTCESTMNEAAMINEGGWQRVFAFKQLNGRGRRGSKWHSSDGSVAGTWILNRKVCDEIHPGLLQTSIGSIVSEALNAEMKWPNDILTKTRKKMGGVLFESSDLENIRIGVGVNKDDFVEGSITGAGWMETLGNLDASQVFDVLDGAISTYFEDNGWLDMPSKRELLLLSWNGISRILSEGCLVEIDGVESRVVGLTESGEIELYCADGMITVDEVDEVRWVL
jgi:biotin-(acetyl-CoA carboxylase) ligase/SAM-dependent methyltransferase